MHVFRAPCCPCFPQQFYQNVTPHSVKNLTKVKIWPYPADILGLKAYFTQVLFDLFVPFCCLTSSPLCTAAPCVTGWLTADPLSEDWTHICPSALLTSARLILARNKPRSLPIFLTQYLKILSYYPLLSFLFMAWPFQFCPFLPMLLIYAPPLQYDLIFNLYTLFFLHFSAIFWSVLRLCLVTLFLTLLLC